MRAFILFIAVMVLGGAPVVAEVALPDGYRMGHYRAAVPQSVPGGATVQAEEVRRLRDEAGAALIDVTPLTLGTVGPLKDRWVVKAPHETIAGSTWLPNVGLGALEPRMEAWFRAHLERLSGGNSAHPLVFYCRADCWMAWNAAKRAAEWGYTAVHWFPGGTDDWFGDLPPFIEGVPEPFGDRHTKVE